MCKILFHINILTFLSIAYTPTHTHIILSSAANEYMAPGGMHTAIVMKTLFKCQTNMANNTQFYYFFFLVSVVVICVVFHLVRFFPDAIASDYFFSVHPEN